MPSDETIEAPMDEKSASGLARSIYADFSIWRKKKSAPKWHPVKKMRYVFFRMIDGCTIQDAIKEMSSGICSISSGMHHSRWNTSVRRNSMRAR